MWLYVAICILIILFIFAMIIYLAYDRSRFQVEQQYSYLKNEIEEAVSQTPVSDEFHNTRNIRKKLILVSRVCKDPVFNDLHQYFEVHNELAFDYNEKLQKNIFRGVAKLMGFKEYPIFRYTDDIVLKSKYGNRTIHL